MTTPPPPNSTNTRAGLAAVTVLTAATMASMAIIIHDGGPIWMGLVAAVVVAVLVGVVVHFGMIVPMSASVANSAVTSRELRGSLDEVERLESIVVAASRGVHTTATETEVFEVLAQTLVAAFPDRDAALLLPPRGQQNVAWSVAISSAGLGEMQPLAVSRTCNALAQIRPTFSASSDDLDACPHSSAGELEHSSICWPVVAAAHHAAVLYSEGAPGELPSPHAIALIETLVTGAAARLEALRLRRAVPPDVPTDSLTGLPTPSSIRRQVTELLSGGSTFSLALCDLDGFSGYNAEHGAEQGDRALRLFGDVVGASIRPADAVARYEGDRFLALFPDCSATHAMKAMDRVRESLALELAVSGLAPVTVSVGICDSGQAATTEDLVEAADIALSVAKHDGGNRIRIPTFDESERIDSEVNPRPNQGS